MSNPSTQRADGCSVFFTFLVLVVLLSGFYIAQKIFEPAMPTPVEQAVDQGRSDMVNIYRQEKSSFNNLVDQFHADRNSSLSSAMSAVVKSYNSPSSNNKPANP